MERRRTGAIIPGLILILLGVWFLLNNLGIVTTDLGALWPVFPLLFGLTMIAGGLLARDRNGGMVMVGVWAALVGLFFFPFSLGALDWEEMGRLWPTFPLIGGLGFLAAFLTEGLNDWGLLILGIIALGIGVFGYIFTYGVLNVGFVAWVLPVLVPALLILAGLSVLISAFTRRRI